MDTLRSSRFSSIGKDGQVIRSVTAGGCNAVAIFREIGSASKRVSTMHNPQTGEALFAVVKILSVRGECVRKVCELMRVEI